MNYYLEMKLQIFIDKLEKLKNEGVENININVNTAIDILSDIQLMNKGKALDKNFDPDSYLGDNK